MAENGAKNDGPPDREPVSTAGVKSLAVQKALRARLDKLSGALDRKDRQAAERAQEQSDLPGMNPDTGKALSMGMRVVSELVAGIVVGGALGWALDKWLGTMPLFMIVLLLLGTAGGVWNVMRTTGALRPPAESSRGKEPRDS